MNPMLANIVLEFFLKGGPVMWPILVCAIVAVAVVGERAFWWWRESQQARPAKNGATAGRAGKFRRRRREENRRRLGRPGHPHDSSRPQPRRPCARLVARRAATGGRHRTETRRAFSHGHGHARHARAAAGPARHRDRPDARLSQHRQRGTVRRSASPAASARR